MRPFWVSTQAQQFHSADGGYHVMQSTTRYPQYLSHHVVSIKRRAHWHLSMILIGGTRWTEVLSTDSTVGVPHDSIAHCQASETTQFQPLKQLAA